MKALITGINGFAGSFLAENLLQQGEQVFGMVQPATPLDNIVKIKENLFLHNADLLDDGGIDKIIRSVSPDVVFHLAGASSVKESLEDPRRSFEVNVTGSLNLLEAIKRHAPKSTIVLVTSSEIYGESLHSDNVTTEDSPILPKSPYAVSKASLDMFGKVYALNFGLNIIIARPFSHIGPRQADKFFVPSVARQIVEIEKKSTASELLVGDLEIWRDYLDVRDVVKAYVLLSQKGEKGQAYNICSGKQYLLKDIVKALIDFSNNKNITMKIDPARLRAFDLHRTSIDNSKILSEIGWEPEYDIIKDTLREILGFWRNRLG